MGGRWAAAAREADFGVPPDNRTSPVPDAPCDLPAPTSACLYGQVLRDGVLSPSMGCRPAGKGWLSLAPLHSCVGRASRGGGRSGRVKRYACLAVDSAAFYNLASRRWVLHPDYPGSGADAYRGYCVLQD